MDKLLNKLNIDRDSMNAEEIATLERWVKQMSTTALSVADVKEYISNIVGNLERELFGYDKAPLTFWQHIFQKRKNRHIHARLQNYVLLRDFLTAPERARSFVEKQVSNLVDKT